MQLVRPDREVNSHAGLFIGHVVSTPFNPITMLTYEYYVLYLLRTRG